MEYLERYRRLSHLLEGPPPRSNFDIDSIPVPCNDRDLAIDALLAVARDDSSLDAFRMTMRDFEVIGKAGEGQYGTVHAAQCRFNGQTYAIKTIPKVTAIRHAQQLNLAIERAVHIIARRRISPVPRLFAAFQSPDSLHLVTSYAPCGTIWDRLAEQGPLASELKYWAPQMVSAITWCHEIGVAHRDIKPHNFLIDENAKLLLTDFGSAAPLLPNARIPIEYCALPIGTPDYVAPEILIHAERTVLDIPNDGYDASVDWWSLGVTLYEIAAGRTPFWARTIDATYALITRYHRVMPSDLPADAADLLSRLLSRADQRLSSTAVHLHPFFADVVWETLNRDSRGKMSLLSSEPHPLDLQIEDNGNVSDDSSPTFDHFFANESTQDVLPTTNGRRWIGWTKEPPPEEINCRKTEHGFRTPARSTRRDGPSTPRTAVRTRSMSDRKAYCEMVRCVAASARKQTRALGPSPVRSNEHNLDAAHMDFEVRLEKDLDQRLKNMYARLGQS